MKRLKNSSSAFLLLGCLYFSQDAQASRARTIVMGSGDPTGRILASFGNDGSFYYDDASQAYANPALILGYPKTLIVEKSNLPGTTAQASIFHPIWGKHQGGLILNRTGSLPFENANPDNRNGVSYRQSSTMRPAELLYAFPFQQFSLGAKLGYATRRESGDGDREEDAQLTVGSKIENFYPVIKAKVYGKSKQGGQTAKVYHFGAFFRYKWEQNITLFGGYDWKQKKRQSDKLDTDDAIGLGIAKRISLQEKTNAYISTGLWRATTERHNIIPIDVSAEHEIINWLLIRGGFSYNLVDVQRGQSNSSDPTSARMGATLRFKPVDFDFVVGSNSGSASRNESSQDPNSQNFGFNDAFFTAGSLTAAW